MSHPSDTGRPDVFVCHSSADAEIARRIVDYLEPDVTCWVAPRDVQPGITYLEGIMSGFERSRAVLLLMSDNAETSPHVQREVEMAVSEQKRLLPVRLTAAKPGGVFRYLVGLPQWLDLYPGDLDEHLPRVAAAIQGLLGDRPSTPQKAPTAETPVVLPPPAPATAASAGVITSSQPGRAAPADPAPDDEAAVPIWKRPAVLAVAAVAFLALGLGAGLVLRGGSDDGESATATSETTTATTTTEPEPATTADEATAPTVASEDVPETIPQTQATTATFTPRSDQSSCETGLYVKASTTSCPFAVNVRSAYESSGSSSIVAHSPTTGLDYSMTCAPTLDVIVCRGGNDAEVTFY